MTNIHDVLVEEAIRTNAERSAKWKAEHKDMPLRLFASDLGKCPREAYLSATEHTLTGIPKTHPPGSYLLELFKLGNDLEDITWGDLHSAYSLNRSLERGTRLDNGVFTGHIDFLLGRPDADLLYPNDDFPEGAIIEHKGTSHWNFSTGDNRRLPYKNHCLQVLMYQKMLSEQMWLDRPAYLYYRVWNQWAQFRVSQESSILGPVVVYDGQINGTSIDGLFQTSLDDEILKTCQHWPEEPPSRVSPFQYDFDCCRKQKGQEKYWPRCSWFSYCWPDYPGKGPIYPNGE